MQARFEDLQILSARELEERRLRRETNGIYAPAKPGIFAETRRRLVEEYVMNGLRKFDELEIARQVNNLNN